MKKNVYVVMILSVIMIFGGKNSLSFAESSIQINSEQQYQFAEQLFNNSEYFKAIGEYQRFIYFFPEDEKVEDARFKIGLSYLRSEHFKEAIDNFRFIINKYSNTELSISSYFLISESYLKLEDYEKAIDILKELILKPVKTVIKDEAYYKIGLVYIQIASWEEGEQNLRNINYQNQDKYNLKQIFTKIDNEKSMMKNPNLAGILSVVPGCGYIYLNRYQDALIAFIFNAGLILSAYDAFKKDSLALGTIISFVELGFYSGNIYGSITSAHKYNKSRVKSFVEDLKTNTTISLLSYPKQKGIAFSLNFVF